MPVELYKKGDHLVVSFNDLVKGEGIQSNQLLIKHGHHSALLDPGGDHTFISGSGLHYCI
jgi:flavorubredoxin